jgi:hypothetical protein
MAKVGCDPDDFPGRKWLKGELEAAWPHMYAAALRDAAERLEPMPICDLLRRWADEAVRGS